MILGKRGFADGACDEVCLVTKSDLFMPRGSAGGLGSAFLMRRGSAGVPAGLTGDIFRDTELVELKVLEICRKHKMTEQDKVELFSSIVLRR